MPDDRNMSAAEYRGTVLSELRGIREKQEELCERLGSVEVELVGKVGDVRVPSLRRRMADVETFVKSARRREKWWMTVASGTLLLAVASGWEWLKKKVGS